MILLRILWRLPKGVAPGKRYYFDVRVSGRDVLKERPLRRERAALLCEQGGPLLNPRIGDALRLRVFAGVNLQHLADALRALLLQQLIELQAPPQKLA